MAKKINFVIAIFFVSFFLGGSLFAQTGTLTNVEGLMLKGAYQQAAKECKEILVQQHRAVIKSKAYYLLGICLLKEAKYDQARENFQIILRRYPQSRFSDDATLSIAESYFLAGDFKQGQRGYEEFLRDFPRSELSSIAQMHLELCKEARPFANSYFSVQLGCFANKKNAGRLRDKLIDNGYQAYILELPGEGFCRVRAGRFSNRLQAEFLEQKLKAEGYSTKVCP